MPTPNNKGELKYRCTACSGHIRSSFEAFLHPLLKVLICRKCHADYGTGDFSQFNDPDVGPGVDENGDDNYCRWCVDGGDLFACGSGDMDDQNRCHYAFCTDCIRRNCPEDEVLCQENFPPETEFKWSCFACNPDKLKKHRQEAQEIILALGSRDLRRPATTSNSNSTINKSSSGKDNGGISSNDINKDNNSTTTNKGSGSSKDISVSKDTSSIKPGSNAKDSVSNSNSSKDSSKGSGSTTKDIRSAKDDSGTNANNSAQTGNNTSSGNKDNKNTGQASTDETVPSKKRKTDNVSSNSGDIPREPEASSMPPVAPPKPPESALRRLSKKSATPEHVLPNSIGTNGQPSSAPPKNYSRNLPNSVNNIAKVMPSSISNINSMTESSKLNGSLMKSRPLSKQLKATTEPIKPSCKVPLSEMELKKRLDNFNQVKANCIKEMDSKFQNIVEMFTSKDLGQSKAILKFEIEDLEKPIQEFTSMLRDLKSLYHSQN